ncbi:MAG: GTPase HflX [Deltaproteobacteria bacterium]|nr:GTPase HflX [Deltaproteobacteria bacterium]
MSETSPARPRAIALGVQLPGVADDEHAASLAELARLAKTLGYVVAARVTQKRSALAPGAVVGEGKLEELVRLAAEADAVLVDHEITPSQARNLEKATGKEVLDRTAVILAIFHRHARSREARLQVELARLAYLAPRLRESGAGRDRQAGGIGAKGAGESHLELDRRKLRDRMAELRRELVAIEREGGTRRRRRGEHATAALVGYTNAGKSSLMRALTGSPVLVADQLFATLDTTVRAIEPPTRPRILVSDTVGFIKKLPHDLVASFRSTLEEARDADLQIHVVDASDPAFRAQLAVTREVLREIGADGAPVLLVLNKRDRIGPEHEQTLAAEFPDAILVSAKRPDDVARLRERILAFFEQDMEETELRVPYALGKLLAEIHASCRVLSESHDERGTCVRLRARPEQLARLRTALATVDRDG